MQGRPTSTGRDALFSLRDRVALVTGASKGIGSAIAAALARQGAAVVVSDKPTNDLTATQKNAAVGGTRVETLSMDVSDIGQVKNGISEVVRRFGRIDILVNNAGVNRRKGPFEVSETDWEEQFDINVRGGFFASQAAARYMIEQKYGRIVFISSQSGISAIPGQPVYCTTKAAVIHLSRCLGIEWGRYGITVNSIAPTFVNTNMTRERLQDSTFRNFVLTRIPVGRLSTKDDVASAVVYLASDEAAMVNGAVLSVDGGWTAW